MSRKIGYYMGRILVLLILMTTYVNAQGKDRGTFCFNEALHDAQAQNDFQLVLMQYISVDDIAAQISWRKWRIRWNDLSTAKREAIQRNIEEVLTGKRMQGFKNVDFSTLRFSSEKKQSIYKIWGTYKGVTGTSNTFEISLYPETCKIFRFTWNNIRLSWFIAQKN